MKRTHPGLASYSLQNLRVFFQLESDRSMNAHRAAADVEWTRQVLGISLTEALKQCGK